MLDNPCSFAVKLSSLQKMALRGEGKNIQYTFVTSEKLIFKMGFAGV